MDEIGIKAFDLIYDRYEELSLCGYRVCGLKWNELLENLGIRIVEVCDQYSTLFCGREDFVVEYSLSEISGISLLNPHGEDSVLFVPIDVVYRMGVLGVP